MPWVRLRSRRDAAFWVPLLVAALLAAAIGIATWVWLQGWQAQLRELASADPEAARARAFRDLRVATWALCAVTTLVGVHLFRFFQLGRREGRLPPSGWWSLGAWRAAVGPTARRMSGLGLVVTGVVVAAAIGLVFAVEHLIRVLQAGAVPA